MESSVFKRTGAARLNHLLIAALVIMSNAPLLAYRITTLPLTVTTYLPVAPKYLDFNGSWKGKSGYKDTDIATMTLNFDQQEIGTDYSKADALARKAAAQLGATAYWHVSGTVYKDTQEIASQTFHLVRNEEAVARINRTEESARSEAQIAEFSRLLELYKWEVEKTEIWPKISAEFLAFGSLSENEQANKIGATVKLETLKSGEKIHTSYDAITKDRLPENVIYDRISAYVISVVRKNDPALYQASYPRLKSINAAYAAQNPYVPLFAWSEPVGSSGTVIKSQL